MASPTLDDIYDACGRLDEASGEKVCGNLLLIEICYLYLNLIASQPFIYKFPLHAPLLSSTTITVTRTTVIVTSDTAMYSLGSATW